MKITSTKTLPIIFHILSTPRFRQNEVQKATGISIGRVNAVTTWLRGKGLVIRKDGMFELVAPNRLAELASAQIFIPHERTFALDLSKEDAIKTITGNGGTLCLKSALESSYPSYSYPEIDAYATDDTFRALGRIERGDQLVHIYQAPFPSIMAKEGKTTDLQTIIDMMARGEHSQLRDLRLKQWDTLQ